MNAFDGDVSKLDGVKARVLCIEFLYYASQMIR